LGEVARTAQDKQVQQLIAFAGAGNCLTVRAPLSSDRSATVPSASLGYCDQCLSQSFTDSGLALQDIVSEIGARLAQP
jgi:hypothetical protein